MSPNNVMAAATSPKYSTTICFPSIEASGEVRVQAKAAGILCVYEDEDHLGRLLILLMEEYNGDVHVIGGKKEETDRLHPEQTAFREFMVYVICCWLSWDFRRRLAI